MAEVMEVLRANASESNDEKNELYYTQKQKRVLKAISENPHASANEVADIAEVHPSYIPYICERVDKDVVDNLHRLEEYLSEREEMDTLNQDESPSVDREALIETFEEHGSIEGYRSGSAPDTVFTFTEQIPVEVSLRFPDGGLTELIEKDGGEEREGEDDEEILMAD
jgi:hypothetical protein